jgi:Putative F0F1-ATPase subunit Ca2+/Mg2+ transporter
MSDPAEQRSLLASYASKGFELAASVAGMALFGYWIGGHYGKALVGVAVGGILGIVGGMYNLVRQSLVASRRAEAKRGNPKD